MRQAVKQIAYKYCVNFAKTEFPYQLTLSLRCKYCKIHSRSIFPDAINSIRRWPWAVAASECKPMTSVFYDVIRLESVRGRSKVLIEGHFWRFLGNSNPKMLSAIVWTQKRHFITSQRVFWVISRGISCTGCFSRRVREKINQNKKDKALYFTYLPRRSLTVDWHTFWVTCLSRGHNQLCKVLS